MMNEHGKSDSPVVPGKLPNKADEAAEAMEGRGLAKGNLIQRNAHRTQSRGSVHSGLERVREGETLTRFYATTQGKSPVR